LSQLLDEQGHAIGALDDLVEPISLGNTLPPVTDVIISAPCRAVEGG
jgi:hypothetical protein